MRYPWGLIVRSTCGVILQDSLEGAQQIAALFESAFAKFSQAQIDALPATMQKARDHARHRPAAYFHIVSIGPDAAGFPFAS
jgi:hypothetical protein